MMKNVQKPRLLLQLLQLRMAALAVASCCVAVSLTAAQGTVAKAESATATPKKVLRYAFRVAESGFDPARAQDYYSRVIIANILDAALEYAYLERPYALRGNTTAMPEITNDFKTFTFKVKPGIYFADDPAFKGKKRELIAEDFVYSLKRHYDPTTNSPNLYILENARLIGLSELRKATREQPGAKFDYDKVIEGAKTIDKYTFQINLSEPQPRLHFQFADVGFLGVVAREVVEFYGDKIMEHPVGTGPYQLVASEWKRSSKIVLERNPNYRERYYDEAAPADNARAQSIAQQLKGRRLPLNDRVEVSIIDENQPRWLSFLQKEFDMVEEVPFDYADIVMPNNQLAPNLKKQGMVMDRYKRADIAFTFFNLSNPMLGGFTPEKVALRRALMLSRDLEREVRLVRHGQAIVAQSIIPPETFPYDASFKTESSEYSPEKANALLDMFGYVDKNGDGWRDMPDGSPLELTFSSQPDDQSRQMAEGWLRDLKAIGIRMKMIVAKWPENLKSARANKLMMWRVGWSGTQPDSENFIGLAYGPNAGQSNYARFDLPEFNRIFEQQKVLPNNEERKRLIQEAAKLIVAYAPYKIQSHQVYTDLYQPWVIGAQRNIFVRDFWKYVDIDTTKLPN